MLQTIVPFSENMTDKVLSFFVTLAVAAFDEDDEFGSVHLL
jgi:hypothetical protein